MRKWHIVRFWATIIAPTESFCVKRSHFFGFTVVFWCNSPHTDKQLKEIWEFGHPCVSSLSDNELMVHKQPPCAKIGGKSVQNRGQSVILSGENHHLPYTITGGVNSWSRVISRLHAGHTRKASRISKAAVDNCGKG